MLDDLICSLTSKARFRVPLFFMLAANLSIMAFNNLAMVFYYSAPSYYCKREETSHGLKEVFLNVPNNVSTFNEKSFCDSLAYDKNGSNLNQECEEYGYLLRDGEWTVVNEWNLVCDWKFLPAIMPSLYFLGTAIGGVVFGHIADHIGRKPVIMICIHVLTVVGVLLYWTPYLWLYAVLRIAVGVFTEPLAGMSLVLLMEFSTPQHRDTTGSCFNLFWSIGAMVFGGIAYFFRSWRETQLAITLPFVASCIYLWVVPESLRWLLTNSKVKRAYKTTKHLARWNNVTLDENTHAQLSSLSIQLNKSQYTSDNYTYLDLLRTPELRKRCLIMLYIFFSLALCYYGILLNLVTLSGNKYINFIIGAAMEFISYGIVILILRTQSRKKFFAAISLLGGSACTIGVIATRLSVEYNIAFLYLLSTGLILLSKAVVSSSFGPAILLFNELFPTVVRSMGLGACVFAMRLGSLLAPQIALIGNYTDSSVPFVIFGVMLLIGGVLVLLLPETRGEPLPDTIQEVENSRNQKIVAEENTSETTTKSTRKPAYASEPV